MRLSSLSRTAPEWLKSQAETARPRGEDTSTIGIRELDGTDGGERLARPEEVYQETVGYREGERRLSVLWSAKTHLLGEDSFLDKGSATLPDGHLVNTRHPPPEG